MERKQATFAIKGMNLDLANSKFTPDLAFENHNIRFTPSEDNTLLVMTNEKGTKVINHTTRTETFEGEEREETNRYIIGYAVIYKTIVLFEKSIFDEESDYYKDYITKLTFNNSYFTETTLYSGDLNFSTSYPIETLPLYESEDIQKVYWVDGLNQPRVINIVGTIEANNSTQFDFLQEVTFGETFLVSRQASPVGTFPGGTIQYGFTYSKKNGQETKIANISRLFYTTFESRAASPEENTTGSYKITIKDADTHFDYINIYSVMRTSESGTPITKLVTKIDILDEEPEDGYEIIDTGVTGETVDPTELLYKGGEAFTAYTIATKDNTLFLGNIKYSGTKVSSAVEALKPSAVQETAVTTIASWRETSGYYPYKNPLKENVPTTYLKSGNYYRIGIQLQDKRGTWSEPLWVEDKLITKRPYISSNTLYLPKPSISYSSNFATGAYNAGYRRIRPVIVYPESYERGVIAQGIVCPTVFNPSDRNNNFPFAQSSWFFRPYNINGYDGSDTSKYSLEARHLHQLPTSDKYNAELQYNPAISTSISNNEYCTETSSSLLSGSRFYIDGSILTFHSPDINDELVEEELAGINMKIVGAFNINSFAGRASITAGLPQDTSLGKVSESTYNVTKNIEASSWVRNYFSTQTLWQDKVSSTDPAYWYAVYPWNRPELGFNSAGLSSSYGEIKTKVLANIRIAQTFGYYNFASSGTTTDYDYILPNGIQDSRIYRKENYESNLSLEAPDNLNTSLQLDSLAYKGSSNKLFAPATGSGYYIYKADSAFDGPLNTNTSDTKFYTEDGIQVTYKSDDHIVLELNNDTTGRSSELPVPSSSGEKMLSLYSGHPYWLQSPTGGDLNIYKFNDYPSLWWICCPQSYYDEEVDLYDEEGLSLPSYYVITVQYSDTGVQYYSYHYSQDSGGGNPRWEILTTAIGSNYTAFNFRGITLLGDVTVPSNYRKVRMNTPLLNNWIDEGPFSAVELSVPSGVDTTSNKEIMWITELTRQVTQSTLFGGNSPYAKKNNLWLPCGEASSIARATAGNVYITEGDTIFNRWDCLKTLPYSSEDVNQVVEIMSFMVESYVNTAGRYDKNRGRYDYTNLTESSSFNLYNNAYNNKDNFFTYRISDILQKTSSKYPSQITWSKTKTLGEDTDTWTNISLTSILNLDGDKGEVRAIRRFKNSLYTFQDKGIAEIIYNPSAAIASSSGIPIEIANSGKVEGKRYISEHIGCSNKWSICTTSQGLYFIDNIDKKLYQWSDSGLKCLSDIGGISSWLNKKITQVISNWDIENFTDIISQYDRITNDVYFITRDSCLAYNERLQQFTSFYNYTSVPWLINLDNECVAVKGDSLTLYRLHKGEYNNFFGNVFPYSVEVVANPYPAEDKIFTNIDFISDSYDYASGSSGTREYKPNLTFNKLYAENEYQKGIETLTVGSTLKKRFRTWYANIPRNTENKGGSASLNYSQDRIRNPWVKIKLSNDSPGTSNTVFYNLNVNYFV